MIEKVKQEFTATFSMIDMGLISFYVGLKMEQDQKYKLIKLFQPIYIEKVLAKFHFDKANLVNTPMIKSA